MTTEEIIHEQKRAGVQCPACGHQESTVSDSRWSKAANGRRRRRQCAACHTAFSTIEVLYVDQIDRDREATLLPAFVQQLKGEKCRHCNGEGIIRKGRRMARVLQEYREECGHTRKAIAERMGLTYEGLEKYENGQRVWPPEKIQQFLVACSA